MNELEEFVGLLCIHAGDNFLRVGCDFLAAHGLGETDYFGEVVDFPFLLPVVVGLEFFAFVEAWINEGVPAANPVFLVVSVMMSKRYLNGGLERSFSDMRGLSMRASNRSEVVFQLLILK